ncbi:MAG: hypothetical protein C0476_03595 [Sphingomonas sp.]|nr:hypothetical protein [Sphingomonas sp.]
MRAVAIPIVSAMIAVGGCAAPVAPPPASVRPAPPVAVPTPAAVHISAPVPAYRGDWRDWPVSAGEWVYRRDARGSIALFGPLGRDATVTLRCDQAAKRLYLSRQGTNATALTLRTSSAARTLSPLPTGGTPPYVAVALAPGDPGLDAIGHSRGRFVMEQPGTTPLVIPTRPEILRVVEDCRG